MGTIIAWIIIGGLAGWIASKIMKRDAQMGIIANIAAGIVGAFIVGWLVSFLTGGSEEGVMPAAFSIPGVLAAIVGACLVIWLVSLVGGRSNRGTRV
ncbi:MULTISPECIES: GlsB/YeaQ/YmgE family stress response membrane protein [unclassified Dietzia]|uniref:GlsB/YeaQ/YmgE family stress response membrane protein n=1 Tax=unclassified Dietzia TaxID=2617939 RepID=UPI0015F9297F|nr:MULTISPECIES: GlsB/YeaQ/YmgE family stress response membrane protein [unclassified Dietzia]MBB1040064.1 GlsB/YeaQ/YmgE family stress response membrane protein [Dietzia sp. Cai40]MBB1045271.1 GlsB/YeaQ/YmgE family stress response membrane protein [Dietzia sp. DQ11-44]